MITPSKYLHQFADDDDLRHQPAPDLSLYLPDCTLGGINGEKFTVKGKDASKGKVGSALATSHELSFKAHTVGDAEKWYAIIKDAASGGTPSSAAASPIESRNVSGQLPEKHTAPINTNQQPTGYQSSPLTPGTGVKPGPSGPETVTSPQVSGTTGTTNTPTSGVERAPGQY